MKNCIFTYTEYTFEHNCKWFWNLYNNSLITEVLNLDSYFRRPLIFTSRKMFKYK